MFPPNFCPFPTQNCNEWENSHRFVLFFLSAFQNVTICFPKIFVVFPLKISLSGKIPIVLSFFFCLLSLQVFSFLFLSYHSFFLFFVLSGKLPFPPTLITSSHLATASHPCRHYPYHHHSFFPLFWCSSFFKV